MEQLSKIPIIMIILIIIIAGIISIFDQAHFGEGSGEIWLDDVSCVSSEKNLFDCAYFMGSDSINCQHSEDVGIRCSNTTGIF